MLIEIIIAILLGVLAGTITGLLPGIHINLISALLLSSSFLLLKIPLLPVACFIISMSVVHSFLDIIPSVFLGAPESATALGVLPGHRYLLKGNALMAVKLNLIGSIFGMALSVFLFPVFVLIIKYTYKILRSHIALILIAVILFTILSDKKVYWAVLIALLSSFLGFFVFSFNTQNMLFPMFSGLFGIPTLIMSLKLKQSIPKQKIIKSIKLKKAVALKAIISGQFSGFLTAMLPGVGSGTAALISMAITRKLGDHGFMVLIGTINTANFILSIATFYTISKARNGSIIAVSSLINTISLNTAAIFLSTALLSGSIAVFLALFISKHISIMIGKVNYKALALATIIFITIIAVILAGIYGFLILFTSTAIGLIAPITKARRTHAMACIIVPVIGYFL